MLRAERQRRPIVGTDLGTTRTDIGVWYDFTFHLWIEWFVVWEFITFQMPSISWFYFFWNDALRWFEILSVFQKSRFVVMVWGGFRDFMVHLGVVLLMHYKYEADQSRQADQGCPGVKPGQTDTHAATQARHSVPAGPGCQWLMCWRPVRTAPTCWAHYGSVPDRPAKAGREHRNATTYICWVMSAPEHKLLEPRDAPHMASAADVLCNTYTYNHLFSS